MIGDVVLYAASRATHSAMESVSRRVTWTVLAAAFLLTALVLAVIALHLVLEPRLGALASVGLIAVGSALIGIACLSMPAILEQIEARRRNRGSPTANAVAAIDQEAKEVVDYFGALQVVASAFLFGLSAGRRVRGGSAPPPRISS